jgi:putative membrane protein
MRKGSWYYWLLFGLFLAAWIWAAVNPLYRADWLLENYLVFLVVPLILIAAFYFRLSKLSYTLITAFMILHVIGSHYTYNEVPFGFILKDLFGSSRNLYDRLVHFSFGFLIAYPVREVFIRITHAKGFWAYWFPIELTLAFSAIYEIIEWLGAAIIEPEVGLAFVGAQGDVWDAQKDMLLAGIGSLITMLVTFFINLHYKGKAYRKEIRQSFHIPRDDEPLGEVALRKMSKKN